MISIMKQNDEVKQYVTEFVADTEADVAELPIKPSEVYPGSVCIVTETSNVYMLNSNGEWKLL